jgi:hypothetical protein
MTRLRRMVLAMCVAALLVAGTAAPALAGGVVTACRYVNGELFVTWIGESAVPVVLATPQSGWVYFGAACTT